MSLTGFAGAAGIKYGLNVRGPKKPGTAPRPALAAFAAPSDDEGDDDDDGGDGRAGANAQIARQQQRARDSQKVRRGSPLRRWCCAEPAAAGATLRLTLRLASTQAQEQYAAALAQDASVFDYDGVYDEMKAATKARREAERHAAFPRFRHPSADAPRAQGPSAVEKVRGQSRYIGQLLVKAQEREREADIVFERRTLKEREKEDHLYGDKEKFVTAAYKKKLAEDAAFAAVERAADAAEAAAEVTKRRDLSAFYANLLTKNTAFGCVLPALCPRRLVRL